MFKTSTSQFPKWESLRKIIFEQEIEYRNRYFISPHCLQISTQLRTPNSNYVCLTFKPPDGQLCLVALYCFRLNRHATPSVGTKANSQKSLPMHIDAFVYCMASFPLKILLTGLACNGSFLLMYRFFSFSNAFVSLQVTNASETSEAFRTDKSL